MNTLQNIQFIHNSDDRESLSHESKLHNLLSNCTEFLCIVAFAKKSGLDSLINKINNLIQNKKSITFLIGLSFYQTEPYVLNKIHQLQKDHPDLVKLYISNPHLQCTFHHKIYLFKQQNSHSIIIGSANLTGGGLHDNYESSILVNEEESYALSEAISQNIAEMISTQAVIPANSELLQEYEQKFQINHIHQALAKRKTDRVPDTIPPGIYALSEILKEMQNDTTEFGFAAQISHRNITRKTAHQQLMTIANHANLDAVEFIRLYEPLVSGLWHSGGLQRGKNIIAQHHKIFQQGLQDLLTTTTSITDPQKAYEILHNHFQEIPKGGVNVITEILHSINNKSFGIMNQNSTSGMRLAGHEFPSHPLKSNVSPMTYADFCQKGLDICLHLRLNDFTELDALFNYAYWE